MSVILLFATIVGFIGTVTATNCPDRWVAYDGSCYLFGHEEMHFTEAEEYCRHHGAHLIHVNSLQENTFIKGFIRNLNKADYWLGMTDETVEGFWKWYDTDTMITFKDWNRGEPNNIKNQDCAIFQGDNGYKWADISCEATRHALCETSFGDIGIFG